MVTFGISIFLANFAALIWTPNFRSIGHTLLSGTWDISGINLSVPKVVSSIGSILTSFAVFWFLRNTRTGKAILAVEMDREAALIMGINTERINSLSFGIGSALVGVAGALLATHYYIYPFVGGTFGLICFCIVALGGFGSIEGAFIAGILVGVVQTLGGYIFDPAYKLAIVFAHVPDHGLDQAARAQGVVGMRDITGKQLALGGAVLALFIILPLVVPHRLASMS